MDFLDEYKSVMEKYTGLKVFGSVSEEGMLTILIMVTVLICAFGAMIVSIVLI